MAASVSPDDADKEDEPDDPVEDTGAEYRAALTADLSRQLAAADGTRWLRVAIGAGILLFVGLISFLAYTLVMRPSRLDRADDEAAPVKAPPAPSGAVRKVPTPSKPTQ